MTPPDTDTDTGPGGPIRLMICEDDDRLRGHLARMLGLAEGLLVVDAVPTAELAEQRLVSPEARTSAALEATASPEAMARAKAMAHTTPAPEATRAADAADAADAGTESKTKAVDVLLLDLELPGMDGLELLARLPGPPAGPEVLILTTYADADRVFEAMRRGAAGYLVKGVRSERLAEAIAEVAAGGTVIEPRLAKRFWNLFRASRGGGSRQTLDLTEAEVEVLTLVARGLTNPEVGATLGTSRRRVKSHLEAIYRKLGVSSRVEAVLQATAVGLISL
jgi:DNA-binding NarL/FixJ family response regulator